MDPRAYEELLSQIVKSICALEGITAEHVRWGERNLWTGASGYQHQIDVSACGPSDLIFVECKCWERKIPVEKVLAFFGRIYDIQSISNAKIHGVIASTRGFQPGADKVARMYGIELTIVKSAQEFAFSHKHRQLLGVSDRGYVIEKATVKRYCGTCNTELLPNLDHSAFYCPKCDG
jgi:hypothetical protein